jgi:hypothetical protein
MLIQPISPQLNVSFVLQDLRLLLRQQAAVLAQVECIKMNLISLQSAAKNVRKVELL